MQVTRNRALLVGLAVLAVLVAVVFATREPEGEGPVSRLERQANTPEVHCGTKRVTAEQAVRQIDPRAFLDAYFCAWKRRDIDSMRRMTLSPDDFPRMVRPAIGPEAAPDRREAIRRRVMDTRVNLAQHLGELPSTPRFFVDGIGPLPADLAPIFDEDVIPKLVVFRVRIADKEERMRTVIGRLPGGWRFVPGLADPPHEKIRVTYEYEDGTPAK